MKIKKVYFWLRMKSKAIIIYKLLVSLDLISNQFRFHIKKLDWGSVRFFRCEAYTGKNSWIANAIGSSNENEAFNIAFLIEDSKSRFIFIVIKAYCKEKEN